MYPVGNGAYRRDYSTGTVIVNPMQTTQTFNLGATYLTPSGSSVSSVTLAPTSAAILSSTGSGSSGAAPSNTLLPALGGTAQVGSQLTATAGNWSGSPTSYAIAWLRCNSSGASCTTISGQTNLTYVLTSADQGTTIRAAVTATNTSGSTTATSAQTAVVQGAGASPGNTLLPALSGTAQVGSQLTATAGNWTGSPTSYAIGWLRCDGTGGNCTTISAQTNLTYVLTSADQGATIRAAITATNAFGSTIAVSNQTAVVQGVGAAPGNTSLPVLTGTAQVGSQLTSTGGRWTGSPTSYAISWLRCDSSGANCTTISGETNLTYLLTSADQGATIRAAVTATNAYGSSTAVSAATAAVQPAGVAPSNTSLPLVSGTAQSGSQLTTTAGTWSGSPTSYAIAWLRCDSSGANCTTISGQTNLTYVVTTDDRRSTIRAAVTAANAYGSNTAVSAPTAAVKH